ncbi:MAG: hypothetical protein AAGJ29_05085 [Pseudomonadota bacterium]
MNFRKLMLVGGALAAFAATPAQASIIDNPQFRVLGLVIVWGADAADNTPVVSDFVIDTAAGAGDADLIAQDVHTVVTGSLTPTPDSLAGASPFELTGTSLAASFDTDTNTDGVLDASDSFAGFFIDGTSDVTANNQSATSFYVASNTAFAIDATATTTTATNFTLADIGYSLSVTQSGDDGLAFGANAQFPHTGGATGGVATGVTALSDMATATNVFTGNQRTAATPGSIASQSVRFDALYTLGGAGGYDLSQGAGEIEATVTYTVFVP